MNDVMNDETLDNTSAFFDTSFTNIDLNVDMERLYDIVDDDKLKLEYLKQIKLDNLRNENYERYNSIDIFKYKNLPADFQAITNDIIYFYSCINLKNILTDSYEESLNNKVILDNIYRRITRLDNMVRSYVKELTLANDKNQKRFSRLYFNNLDISEKLKKDLINKYDNLVISSSSISKNPYEELHNQETRKYYISEILNLIDVEEYAKSNFAPANILVELNKSINLEIKRYKEIIQYLTDLIPEGSKYTNEFNEFVDLFNKIIAYNDTNLENAKQTYEILSDSKFINRINSFEQLFIDERLYLKKAAKFIYEKVGIKNLSKSLNYIQNYYKNKLNIDDLDKLKYISDKLNSGNYDLGDLNYRLKQIVKNIWSSSITDVYEYNPNDNFCFICSNNQFIDEKYQTILITKSELNKVNSYEDYQIGFICNYNDNILYITENESIMEATADDMSDLKTPAQLEQEFIDFKVCNRIALNGYKTKISAVYFINDGDKDKYIKALELANIYKLPLIEFKK